MDMFDEDLEDVSERLYDEEDDSEVYDVYDDIINDDEDYYEEDEDDYFDEDDLNDFYEDYDE